MIAFFPDSPADYQGPWLVYVESIPGSGQWQWDPRLIVEEIAYERDRYATARLSVCLGGDSTIGEVTLREAVRWYARPFGVSICWLGTPAMRPQDRPIWFFLGQSLKPEWGWSGTPRGMQEGLPLLCEGRLKLANEQEGSIVAGRWIETPGVTSPVWISALPCSFNWRGKPNRSPLWQNATAGGWDGSYSVKSPAFCADGRTDAEFWTVLQVIWYVALHNVRPTTVYLDGFWTGFTSDQVQANPLDSGEVYESLGPLANRLLQVCGESAGHVQGLHGIDAIVKLGKSVGVSVHEEPTWVNGRIVPYVVLWAPGSRSWHWIPHFRQEQASFYQTANYNRLGQIKVLEDSSQILTRVAAEGEPRRYELTLNLQPGWPIDHGTADYDTDDRKTILQAADTAIADTLLDTVDTPGLFATDSWLSQYHPSGAEFEGKRDIGRLWVLNEDGRLVDQARQNYPITTFSQWPVSDGRQFVCNRPRPILPCLSADASGVALRPFLEASFDGGITWEPLGSLDVGCATLETCCGVRLTGGSRSLHEIKSKKVKYSAIAGALPAGYVGYDGDSDEFISIWAAEIVAQFRLRGTFCVEGDFRVLGDATNPYAATPFDRSRYLNGLRKWALRNRSHGNSVLTATHSQALTRDDSQAVQAAAERSLGENGVTQVSGCCVIPWITADYGVGDSVRGVLGEGRSFATLRGGQIGFPAINKVTWRVQGNISTTIQLEDDRIPA